MTPAKRATDILLALSLGLLLALPALAIALLLLGTQGRPVLYGARRMCAPGDCFTLWKFRTMTPDPDDAGVTAGHKQARITPLGTWLRRCRIDELPQLWNILSGDMSFVGPRPPLPAYVARFPDLYARVLRSRPGLTGLATLRFHQREARLLARCATAAEAEAVYARRCIPRKARLDLIYQNRRTLALDLRLLAASVLAVLLPPARTRRG